MTLNALLAMVVEHWVLMSLVLCPILIVLMALAALSCEACGAPFGIFRRRNRTIDLCLRCALLHDIRRASDARKDRPVDGRGSSTAGGDSAPGPDSPDSPNPPDSPDRARSGVSGGATPKREERRGGSQEERRDDRRYAMQPAIELGVAGHRGPR